MSPPGQRRIHSDGGDGQCARADDTAGPAGDQATTEPRRRAFQAGVAYLQNFKQDGRTKGLPHRLDKPIPINDLDRSCTI